MTVRQNVTIYGRSNMYQFEHESKQIKVLLLRSKSGQTKRISTLALLATLPSLPLIATIPSLSLKSHAYPARKPLSSLLRTPSRYSAFESVSAFASHRHVHK